ncbi:MAG: hypothetical protein WC027_00665 [Candidatus Paceibacterota bacterium]
MTRELNLDNYIPLDKYWMIRMGVLDILNGKKDIVKILEKEDRKNLGGDVSALFNAAKNWETKNEISVGESGTLFRYLQFAIWKLKLNKKLIKEGTLIKRDVCNNPEIVKWPLAKLLELDKGTSQWASAAVLLGNEEKIENSPYFLKLTSEALKHWQDRRKEGLVYDIRHDQILGRQAEAFLELLEKNKTSFRASNPDDYCFARAFNLINKEEGAKRFPAIQGHESNRLDEMEKCLRQFEGGEVIETNDHRVVQSIAMLGVLKNKKVKFSNPGCVSKSWPQFWDFLKECFPNKV